MNVEINNKTKTKIDILSVKKITEKFLKQYLRNSFEVSIALVGDATMRKLNNTYRGLNKVTDVLAFPEIEFGKTVNKPRILTEERLLYPGVSNRCGALHPAPKSLRRDKVRGKVNVIPKTETKFLGEIIIDYAQVKRQAKKFGNSNKKELIFILIHGLLHLLGYNDTSGPAKKKMDKLSKEFMSQVRL